jgi:hypothetical protein
MNWDSFGRGASLGIAAGILIMLVADLNKRLRAVEKVDE